MLSGSGGVLPGDMEDLRAEGGWFSDGEGAGESDELGPCQQGLGDEGDVQPRLVGAEIFVGLVGGAGRFPGSDAVLNTGVAPVTQFESGDVGVVAVGEKQGVASPLDLIEDRQRRPGMRIFPAVNQP